MTRRLWLAMMCATLGVLLMNGCQTQRTRFLSATIVVRPTFMTDITNTVTIGLNNESAVSEVLAFFPGAEEGKSNAVSSFVVYPITLVFTSPGKKDLVIRTNLLIWESDDHGTWPVKAGVLQYMSRVTGIQFLPSTPDDDDHESENVLENGTDPFK